MEYVLLFGFLALTILGVPVAFALALTVASVLVFFMDKPLVMVTHHVFGNRLLLLHGRPLLHAGR